MDLDTKMATAFLAALASARDHGGATSALAAADLRLPPTGRLEGLSDDLGRLLGAAPGNDFADELLALGFLAGVVHRPRARTRRRVQEPTCFVVDRELVVQAAEGESILRLPWFEDALFVGRQLPDVSEIPARIRARAVASYRTALDGERCRYSFASYGHAYCVDAVPVRDAGDRVQAVLAIAIPQRRARDSCAADYQRTAERLEGRAELAEHRADKHRLAGRADAEAADRQAAQKARQRAKQARRSAAGLHARHASFVGGDPPALTPRETEVIALASHGLTHAEIADVLAVSTDTIKTHMSNTYRKLGVSDKAGAVAVALRCGLIE
jgi:DNA-binding CsgD family transcriptional regulator